MKNKKNIAGTVWQMLEPVAAELGYSIWDVEYVKEGGDMHLKVTIDSPDGIGIEDCERFQRASDPIIDTENPIEEQYIMEVSSPGLERDIKYDWHFKECEGEEIVVKLYTAFEGSKMFIGKLISSDESTVVLDIGQKTVSLEKKSIAKTNLYFDFTNIK